MAPKCVILSDGRYGNTLFFLLMYKFVSVLAIPIKTTTKTTLKRTHHLVVTKRHIKNLILYYKIQGQVYITLLASPFFSPRPSKLLLQIGFLVLCFFIRFSCIICFNITLWNNYVSLSRRDMLFLTIFSFFFLI